MQRLLLFFGVLLLTVAAFGQTPSTESKTLQTLLNTESQALQSLVAEVRQLSQNFRTSTAMAQRVQIALYRFQAQEAAMDRAQQRLNEVRGRLTDMQSNRKRTAAQVQQLSDIRERIQDQAERKGIDEGLSRLKAQLEIQGNEEQQWQGKETEAQGQVRSEQEKLSELQDLLDRLDRALEDFGHQSR